jgi:hypothetical protein
LLAILVDAAGRARGHPGQHSSLFWRVGRQIWLTE